MVGRTGEGIGEKILHNEIENDNIYKNKNTDIYNNNNDEITMVILMHHCLALIKCQSLFQSLHTLDTDIGRL